MSRYIDADALSDAMYHEAFETDSEMQKWDSGCWIRYKMFEKHIEQAPSIDIEQKRGEWISKGKRIYRCSNCGNYLDFDGVNASRGDANFCPNCGAHMKGADDETN